MWEEAMSKMQYLKLNVFRYHKAGKSGVEVQQLARYDVVPTTYKALETEQRALKAWGLGMSASIRGSQTKIRC